MSRCMPTLVRTLSSSSKSIILMFIFAAALMEFLPAQPEAQTTVASSTEATAAGKLHTRQSIGDLLSPEGTMNLKSGYSGSLDLQGYKMLSAPGEAPRFARNAAPGDERWSDSFSPLGMGGYVNALAVDGNGNLYAGGWFTSANGVPANNIAKWNGSTWSALGSGIEMSGYGSAAVYALALDASGNLYAGGIFASAGGVAANNIAKWNGNEWSALGSGMNDAVWTLILDAHGNLHAGGRFTTASGVAANYIAKWNGSAWSALGSGMGVNENEFFGVYALAVDATGNIYAGGRFTTAGGSPARYVAKWNGSAWSALGSGIGSDLNVPAVFTLALDSWGNLYAGGHFSVAGDVPASNIAFWNGNNWSALGPGTSSIVCALTTDKKGNLYAGGVFAEAGGVITNNVARWNGNAWFNLGSGVHRPLDSLCSVDALAIDRSGTLYAGGRFNTAGGVAASSISKWNNIAWSPVGSGSGLSPCDPMANPFIQALSVDGNGSLYAGGYFTTTGVITANYIAKWNGSAWSALGAGTDRQVMTLSVDGRGNLYAGGQFTAAGGVTANHIAKWNGSTWSALGSGVNNSVWALAVDANGNVYAAGFFTMAGGVTANSVAKWNGTEWSALGSGIDGSVHALVVDASGTLYAGGLFTAAGGVAANYIAKWNGTTWSALGSGFDNAVLTLSVDGSGNLYAGGYFSTAGGASARGIAKWNGTEWSALGSGFDNPVEALAVGVSGNLYAGGLFEAAGSEAANCIAEWNGTKWSGLGSGIDSLIQVLAADVSGSLYAGGYFNMAGGKPARGIAKWMGRPALAVDFVSEGLQLWNGSRQKISSQQPSVLSTWGNRLVVSFPELGLYLHEGSSWEKLSSLKSAESVLGITDSLYVDAGAQGIYRYKQGWTKIHTSNPTMMASCGEKLVAGFPDTGVWEYNGSEWKRISSWTTAEQMVGIQQRLFVDFGAKGIYRYDGSWVRTTKNNPKLMHAFGTTLVASIDSAAAQGIFLYQNNSWKKISPNASAEGFASTPFTLYIDRGTQGISKYEKKTWREISSQNPDGLAIFGGKLVANLPEKGLYLYSNPGWSSLSTSKDAGLMQGVLFE
ncbi:MAG: hypothetical protein AB9866_09385 [Syntrophobacteraceae bacterium]